MPRSQLDDLLVRLRAATEGEGFKTLEISSQDPKERRLIAELFRGPEVSLQARCAWHREEDRAISFSYSILLRWPRAEALFRDLQPPLPCPSSELPREVIEARKTLWPIASVRITEYGTYFRHLSPIQFQAFEFALIDPFVTEVVETFKETVVPDFARYCDVNILAERATSPEVESHLLISPFAVATILAVAGRYDDFMKWWQQGKSQLQRGNHPNAWPWSPYITTIANYCFGKAR